mmetsp:Transcript_88528/g.246391  ORF Transcript_88528/g.246391 Transcript_88528/m.246391 type:complete len:108 (+) Transcript_88528:208-531(+)
MGAFEVVGFLDAAKLLQQQAAERADPDDGVGLPPSGVGERALRLAVTRVLELMPQLQEDEALAAAAGVLQSLRLPADAAADARTLLEAAEREAAQAATPGTVATAAA